MNLDENMFFKRIVTRLKQDMPAGSGGQGPVGPSGAAGRDGKDGAVGSQGPKGDQGVAGPPGRDGVDGAAGAAGKDGAPGAAGKDGTTGATGATGAAGKDAKRSETYVGVTDTNGLYTVTYATAFPAVPSVQPTPPLAANQTWVTVTSTTTGFSLRLVQRAAVTVLGAEVLLAGVTNAAAAPARVVVIAA